jgi:hypothetical protein
MENRAGTRAETIERLTYEAIKSRPARARSGAASFGCTESASPTPGESQTQEGRGGQ